LTNSCTEVTEKATKKLNFNLDCDVAKSLATNQQPATQQSIVGDVVESVKTRIWAIIAPGI